MGRQADSPTESNGPIFHKSEDWWIVVGDKDVVPSLEMGIRFAHVGETVAVWSHSKFAYGPSTRHYGIKDSNNDTTSSSSSFFELPPDSNVRYEVTVKQLASSQERTDNSWHWILTTAESKKNIGNDAYAHEWSNGQGKTRIKYIYEKAAKELVLLVDQPQEEGDADAKPDEDKTETDETCDSANEKDTIKDDEDNKALLREKARVMLVDCLNNIVAVHLRAKEYHAAKEAAVKVLQRDPSNFKGLIRAAKAALLDPASSYEEVNAAIKAAAEKATGVQESDLVALRLDFQRRKLAYEKRSKQMYSKALGGGGKSTSTKTAEESNATSSEPTTNGEDSSVPLTESNALSDSLDREVVTEGTPKEGEKKPFCWSDRTTWPWSTIMAYIFQLSLPFVMWSVAQRFRADRPLDGATTASTSTVDPADVFRAASAKLVAGQESTGFDEEF